MSYEEYRYTERTWDALARRCVDWRDVEHVLRVASPKVRRFYGETILFVTALDRGARWLTVTLSELLEVDDVFEIVDARYLGPDDGPVEIGEE